MSSDIDGLVTEGHRPELMDIDRASTRELVRLMNDEDASVPAAVARAADDIAAAIDAIAARMRRGGRLIYVGAGTAGRLGVLDASECMPTFSTPDGLVVGVLAGGRDAFGSAVERAEDDFEGGAADLAALAVAPEDSVVGLSASGRTPYVLGAVAHAREAGALTVGLSCNAGTRLSAAVERAIEVVVGPEVIAGSTRLKAGTAQKLVLNMISTITMVRLGKTYGNLMVDVRVSNEKLRVRAQRIVAQATGRSLEEASAAFAAAGEEVKTAIVMLERGLSPEEARAALERAGGVVRAALEARSGPLRPGGGPAR